MVSGDPGPGFSTSSTEKRREGGARPGGRRPVLQSVLHFQLYCSPSYSLCRSLTDSVSQLDYNLRYSLLQLCSNLCCSLRYSLCYSCVTAMLRVFYHSVTAVLHVCYHFVTAVLQLCYHSVTAVLQLRYSCTALQGRAEQRGHTGLPVCLTVALVWGKQPQKAAEQQRCR